MKLFLDTFGCSSNQATSESISWIVSSIGFELVDVKDKYNAEIYLCNTCTVKYTTEQKILYQIK